jgi:putative transposase
LRRTYTEIYLHLIWGTWDRLDLIHNSIEPILYQYLRRKCEGHKCWLDEIGGTFDHVHLLIRLNSTIAIGELVKSLKGSSSHYIAQIHQPGFFFKWQGGYSAFSVSSFHIPKITKYIKNQKTHHLNSSFINDWELVLS